MMFKTPDYEYRRRLTRSLCTALMLVGLTSCADPSGIQPQSQLRDAHALGLTTPAAPESEQISTTWWRSFGDETLNRLVEQALHDNPSLKIAQARLSAAQAVGDVAASSLLPQVGARLDLTQQRYTANGMIPPPLAGAISDSGTLQIAANWELDFFGKNRAALDAALGRVRASQADSSAARVLLASQVARSYFQLSRVNAQQAVAQQSLQQAQAMLGVQQQRFEAGLDALPALRQSMARVAEARVYMEALQEQGELLQNTLAALLGQGKLAHRIEPTALESIAPIPVPANLSADLLGRRADISAARWRVQAASDGARYARQQFYPNVNLTAFAGFSSIGLDQLLHAGSQQWGISPALSLPVFDAGRLRAGLRTQVAELDASVQSYNLAVIGAVHEAADQLASVQAIERQQAQQHAASLAVQDAYAALDRRYQAGLLDRISLLRAQTDVLAQRRLHLDLMARALDARVALIHALGGGYSETSTDPTP